VTAVEDRTRAAMDAVAGLVERVPPLTLPPPPGAVSRRRGRVPFPRRRWGAWLAPVTAAAAVVAIAIALVAVRDMPDGGPTPPPGPGLGPVAAATGIPTYYLTFSQPSGDTTTPVALVLAATLTGKKLFTLQPPRGLSFAGITGAADDRTFVADAHADPYGVAGSAARSRTWYLVRIVGTGPRASLTMRKLPIPPTPVGTRISAIALSPDATKLAVATERLTDDPHEQQFLRVYSVAAGAALHTWSSPADQIPPIEGAGYYGADPNSAVAWVGERALAYNQGRMTKSGATLVAEVLDLTRPDGDLLGSSRTAAILPGANDRDKPAPFGCNWFWEDVMITGDGKSYVCGGNGTSAAQLPKLYCLKRPTWNVLGFAGISLATGKLTGILSGYRTGCSGYTVNDYPVWVNATGSAVIGYMIFGDKTSGRFGVFSHGSFRPLPYPVAGNSYQYEAGSLLNQVAW
jgi:hypothetical protein